MKFDLENDIFTQEAICLLESAGIDFKKLKQKGIDIETFAEHMLTSGIILNENVTWITFHGTYDFAYILRMLTNLRLPDDENEFLEELDTYFKNFYDIRTLVNELSFLKGSLNKMANSLDVKRVGAAHQAGSDSLVTSKLFFRIVQQFGDQIDLEREKNNVFGLVDEYMDTGNKQSNQGYEKNVYNNNGQFSKVMMPPPGFNYPMTMHSNFIYQQNVNNFYKPNINNGFFNNFLPPQFDMMRFSNYNGNILNGENELNYISNGNIVTN